MKGRWIARKVGAGILFAVAAATVLGFVVMLLWNALVPALFNGPALTFWQAVGLLVLSHILLRGWGHGLHRHGWHHERWRHKFDERLASMTPEEREKFKQEWRRRCGWFPEETTEKADPSQA